MPEEAEVDEEKQTTDEKNDPLGIAIRQFGAIGGAVSLVNLVKDSLEWQHAIGKWLDAIRAFTRPVATFLFGWIPILLHLPFPGAVKDYLVVGVITALALFRALIVEEKETTKVFALDRAWLVRRFGHSLFGHDIAPHGWERVRKAITLRKLMSIIVSVFAWPYITFIRLRFVLLAKESKIYQEDYKWLEAFSELAMSYPEESAYFKGREKMLRSYIARRFTRDLRVAKVFLSAYVYAVAIITVNYLFIAAGAKTE
jgi:hypothetical protein